MSQHRKLKTKSSSKAKTVSTSPNQITSEQVNLKFSLGVKHFQSGNRQEAEVCLQELLQWQADHSDACNVLGIIAAQQTEYVTAIEYLERAIAIKPTKAEYYSNLGNIYFEQQKLTEAIELYQKSLQIQANNISTHYNLGKAYQKQGNFSEAIASYQTALQLKPDYEDAHYSLGEIYSEQKQYSEAINSFQKAIALQPAQAKFYNSLAFVYSKQKQLDQAVEYYQKAIVIKPDYALAYYNLGVVSQEQTKFAEALACYQKAIEINLGYADARFAIGFLLLSFGNFQQGLAEYEWRLEQEKFQSYKPKTPMWDGSPLEGKSIVLWNEQGFGDGIQFVRYAQQIKNMGAEVTITVLDPLIPLFQKCLAEQFAVIEKSQCNIYAYDYHASLMSLPYILQTDLDSIPNNIPYIFAPPLPPECLLPSSDNYRIGIVWAGQVNTTIYQKKSCNPELFLDLLDVGNVSLYSLQFGEDADKIQPWLNNNRIHDLTPLIKNFADTAGMIEQLDLVITVDTAVAHLAGAMGKPVWVLLPLVPDWRWLLEREDSPWYPTMRLFRQSERDNWETVFQQVKKKLTDVLQGESPTFPVAENKSPAPMIQVKIPQIARLDEVNKILQFGMKSYHQGDFSTAEESLKKVLKLRPKNVDALHVLGVIAGQRGEYQTAIQLIHQAVQIKPEFIEAHHNLAAFYTFQGDVAQAEKHYQKAIDLKPDYWDAHCHLGILYKNNLQLNKAIECLQRIIQLNPHYVKAHATLGHILLLLGKFNQGFAEYEWRLKQEKYDSYKPETPMWDGLSSIEGKSLVLWNEQGLGDAIQFVRYAQKLKSMGAKVILMVQKPLIALFSECLSEKLTVLEQNKLNINAYDCHASIMSLPNILQTDLDNIPQEIPYIYPPQNKRPHCTLPSVDSYRIGIVWASGNLNSHLYHQKSCSPDLFIDLLKVGNISLYSLQVGKDADQIKPWLDNQQINDLSPLIQDFVDTACLIEQLDLIITVDTAVAHLAGAMGKPVWVLLPFVPDWRWLLERKDSPWYPTMRLFRQMQKDDWLTVFQQVKDQLAEVLQGKSPIFSVNRQQNIPAPVLSPSKMRKLNNLVQSALKYYQIGNLNQAQAQLIQVLKIQPKNVDALHLLGIIAGQKSEYQTAIPLINQAIQIKPDFAEAHYNLGIFYVLQGELEKGQHHYLQAIHLKPDYSEAYYHLGIAYREQLQLTKAIESWQQAIKLNPNYIKAHSSLGHALLLQGNFEQGLLEYEWRFKKEEFRLFNPQIPMWDGSEINNKSIVLWNEQGLGDALQFVRYAQKLKQQGAKIILSVQLPLVPLFQECLAEQFEVVERQTCDIYAYDCHASLMSLPYICQTRLNNIPNTNPYIFAPHPLRPNCVLPPSNSYRIGIVWAGQRQNANYEQKSFPPQLFMDLLKVGKISLYSLQVGEDAEQIKPWLDNQQINDLSPLIQDFVDTACLIEQLDLVITIDTAVAHLAGAMGKPVWVLLPFVPDWRWLLEREDSPWYPTMRLFRQTKREDWESVFAQVKEKLALVLQGEFPIFPLQAEKSKQVKEKLRGNQSTIVELSKRGESCYQHGDFEAAKIAYAQAYSLNPQNIDLCINLAACHFELKELEMSCQLLENAIRLEPNHSKAHYFLGMILLLCGEFKRGWPEYEWISQSLKKYSQLSINLKWEGQNLVNKNIILWDEQGFGDTIQFIRYAPMVASLGAKVFLDVKSPLRRLFKANPSLGIVMDDRTSIQINAWSRIVNLPQLFECDLGNIENQIPYINPPSEAVIPPVLTKVSKFKIGLVWKGSPINSRNAIRSIDLSLCKSLLLSSNCSFFSLHNQSCEEEIEAIGLSNVIVDLADVIGDFADLAVIIDHLDLVITVDTAVAHLAGAMGKPVWVLLSFVPDWRWLLEREDTPWYPTMRLFRQPQRGDWENVIAQVQEKLVEVLQGESPLFPVERKSIFSMSQNSMSKTTNHQTLEVQLKLASELIDKNQLTQAQLIYEEILASDPLHLKSNFSLGWIHQQQGKFSQALEYYHQIISIYPENIETLNNVGNVYQAQGNSEQAIAIYHKIVELQPHHPYGYYNLGVVYEQENKFAEALEFYQRAIAIDSRFIYAHYNLGNLYQKQNQLAKAIESYQKVAQIQPNYKNVYLTLGFLSQQLNQFPEAVDYYQELIKLEPNIYSAYYNLGIIYGQQEDFSSAINYYQKAIALKHDYSPAYNNLGRVYELQGQFNQALQCFQKAIQLQPNHASAHLNRGLLLLLLGEWEEGFPEYEWRFESHAELFNLYKPETTIWDGSSLEGKSIVLWNEQGLGDALQFVRYAQKVKQQDAKIILSVQSSLVPLFQHCLADQFEVVERKTSNTYNCDFQASLMSLPGIFQTKPDNIPDDNPYIFAPTPLRPDCILPPADSYRVGIVWAGQVKNPKYQEKSCSPQLFLDLLALDHVSFYSLQVGQDAEQIKPYLNSDRIHDLSSKLKDFVDTACVIEQLDLVITVDTSVAHLAGAMGKPVWVLLPFIPDWRWLLEREDSPWYPTMRLFRQPQRGDWVTVFDRIKHKLKTVLEGESPIFPRENMQLETKPDVKTQNIAQLIENQLKLACDLFQQGKLPQAKVEYEKYLQYDNHNPYVNCSLGFIYQNQGQFSEAISYYQKALKVKPDYIQALNNLGNIYRDQDQLEPAISYYQKALEIKPDYEFAHNNLGCTYYKQGQFNQALECYQKAIQYQPNYAEAHLNKGLILLLLEQWEEGLREYEWRLSSDSSKSKTSMWDGSSLEGKSIVLWNEQGLGDALQFVRYAQKLKQQGINVILSVQSSLVPLFQDCLATQFEVIDLQSCDIYAYDFQASLISLPRIFQTRVNNIPQENPYIFAPNPLRPNCLLPASDSFRVGIVWASQKQNGQYHDKSCSVKLFMDLLEVGNISLYSLQVAEDGEQIKPWLDNQQINDLSPLIQDFVDTACLIEQLDLVITVDTSVAHLAGAMGKPVWVILPFVPDWRWLLEREDTPWYPTMRLFRQAQRGDWVTVFDRIKQKLKTVLEGESPIFPLDKVKSLQTLDDLKKLDPQNLLSPYTNQKKPMQPDLNIRSFDVVVPAFNCEKVIIPTLQSINENIKFFQASFSRSSEVTPQIVVVNDASSDNTLSVVTEFAQDNPHIKVVSHTHNRGAAAARNTGVDNSQGDILFFCDGDDLFLPEHIYVCFMMLQGQFDGQKSFELNSDKYKATIPLPEVKIHAINTGVKTKEKLHPHWKKAIENSIPLNLCVRRECHQFIEGFLEDEIHQQTKTEDCVYNTFLKNLFVVVSLNLETVEYIRYPNNAFDKQLEKFQLPPGEYQGESHIDKKLLQQAHKIQQEKLLYLQQKKYQQAFHNKGYKFSNDWFSINIPVWTKVLTQFKNAPNIHFLEIGSWEGRSSCWLLDNILTHESAKLTCVDTFEGSIEHQNINAQLLESIGARFDFNITQTGAKNKVNKIVGSSQEVLRTLPLNTYDVLYIDGSHIATDVLEDALLGWRLVKVNGLIIFDDYNWPQFKDQPTQHPKLAVDSFMSVFRDKIKLISKGYQVVIQKITD